MALYLTKFLELIEICDDTDGGSRPSLSNGTAVDYITGDDIPLGVPVIEYYDADGNVYATCKKPVDDMIKTAGEIIPAGTIINGVAIVAAYTVQNGEEWIFDGDEACIKTRPHAVTLESINPAAGTGGDDTAALYAAIDKAHLQDRARVQLGGKTYNFDQPIVIAEDREGIMIEGCGTEAKRFDSDEGTVLNFRIESGDGLTIRGTQTQLRDISLKSETTGWVFVSDVYLMSSVKNIQIHADGVDTNGMRVERSWTNIFENIDIYKTLQNRKGIGFWHDTTVGIAGGNTLFENITASYFDQNMEFGQEKPHSDQKRRNNTVLNCQGRFGNTGIRFGSGYGRTEVINAWAEWNTYAQVQVHSGAGSIWFRGLELSPINNGYGLVLGIDPALGANTEICPVTVQNTEVRAWSGFAGVKIFTPTTVLQNTWHEFDDIEFWNNGGPRIETDPVAQIPVLVRRQKTVNGGAAWNNFNVMVSTAGTAYQAPLSLQTAPTTQI